MGIPANQHPTVHLLPYKPSLLMHLTQLVFSVDLQVSDITKHPTGDMREITIGLYNGGQVICYLWRVAAEIGGIKTNMHRKQGILNYNICRC